MMPMDGRRSTFFEWDLQIFYVEFNVVGASISNIRLFRPRIDSTQILQMDKNSGAGVMLNPVHHSNLAWDEYNDPDLNKLFFEKYVPRAVTRRINP